MMMKTMGKAEYMMGVKDKRRKIMKELNDLK